MRVTNSMMLTQAISDLGALRQKYMQAQNAVNGKVLERPSEDPIRVAEAMDLSGMKLRIERAQRAAEDAKQWLTVAEGGLSNIIDRLQAARETAVQAGNPGVLSPDSRVALADQIDGISQSILTELNRQHRDQFIFAGFKTTTKPFAQATDGSAQYSGGTGDEITRDVAPGLPVVVNVPGDKLMAGGDFLKTLADMAADLRAGKISSITQQKLSELDSALSALTVERSNLGVRQVQVDQYSQFAQSDLFEIEDRLSKISGGDLETAVLKMTEAQSAYQAALASFAKALPQSLLDYLR